MRRRSSLQRHRRWRRFGRCLRPAAEAPSPTAFWSALRNTSRAVVRVGVARLVRSGEDALASARSLGPIASVVSVSVMTFLSRAPREASELEAASSFRLRCTRGLRQSVLRSKPAARPGQVLLRPISLARTLGSAPSEEAVVRGQPISSWVSRGHHRLEHELERRSSAFDVIVIRLALIHSSLRGRMMGACPRSSGTST
jgi:hypothetical protein